MLIILLTILKPIKTTIMEAIYTFTDGLIHFGICVFFIGMAVELLGVQWSDIKKLFKNK